MPDVDVLPFSVDSMRHPALGKLLRLRFTGDLLLRLTPAEASSLSFALFAVRNGISPEREIYMSPIASDSAFVGTVRDDGMSIAIPGGQLKLDWTALEILATALIMQLEQQK